MTIFKNLNENETQQRRMSHPPNGRNLQTTIP